ncbi:AfsA-related hotdog domain-containing protein [Salipiger mucosus]|uniref:AfsA-related hotdog domain-containing protein n=1 Tax=Salipiger mucosus TaxID=263378 RepID=UPI0018DC2373|nr:AfsA-related hotdog domain-containing protein [Salipiger mucosus]
MQLVTGNRFKDFAAASGAISAQTAIDRLLAGESCNLVIGQGVSEQDANVIAVLGAAAGHRVARPALDHRRAGRDVCHKHHPENQLISAPRRAESDIFEADILVDDRNEILSDHLTGCHLQGMLLIEATRQMFIAVGETQYEHLGVPTNGYVVFDRLTAGFEQFAFPLPTWIRQTVTRAEKVKDDRVAFAASIEIFQAQGRVAQSEVSYTIFDAGSLGPKEERLANKAADALFSSLGISRDDVTADQPVPMAGA